jgi:diguanylate cyclase (GGDEF)-like protein/PAS domain S-box-containing protein
VDATHYRQLFSDLPVAWVVHEGGVVRDFNRAAMELFAVDDAAAHLGRRLLDFVHAESAPSVQERLRLLDERGQPVRAVAERMVRADGQDLWVETIASRTVFDGRPAVQVLCWDVTGRVRVQEQLAHAALHDGLTGLPNRAMLEQRWKASLAGRSSGDGAPAVLFCDLDGFKGVNDAYGHAVGDATLRAVAGRLSGALRDQDLLGRYGGDEFVALVDAATPDLARHVAERLTDALREPVHVADTVLQVAVTVGVARPATADEPLESVLRRADQAMYARKRGARRER